MRTIARRSRDSAYKDTCWVEQSLERSRGGNDSYTVIISVSSELSTCIMNIFFPILVPPSDPLILPILTKNELCGSIICAVIRYITTTLDETGSVSLVFRKYVNCVLKARIRSRIHSWPSDSFRVELPNRHYWVVIWARYSVHSSQFWRPKSGPKSEDRCQ